MLRQNCHVTVFYALSTNLYTNLSVLLLQKFTVPLPDEEGNGSGKFQTFSFSLKPMAENGPQGSFECLQTNLTTRPG